ncbi:hypothetical protein E2C01_058138 [Portunus trituberculatus]|uniref:Uncharacterized protein n=1 Tax=Portunus trituberculatus TaxID=210409 RepID=A0A5B7H4H6_PORTR|nr:hypothetical protein [Portunus trituberculatus]
MMQQQLKRAAPITFKVGDTVKVQAPPRELKLSPKFIEPIMPFYFLLTQDISVYITISRDSKWLLVTFTPVSLQRYCLFFDPLGITCGRSLLLKLMHRIVFLPCSSR